MSEWKEAPYILSPVTQPLWHGANKDIIEFRFSELKGSLRFWWRAVNEYENSEIMHKYEAEFFGSTECQSPIQFIPSSNAELKPMVTKPENIYFHVKCYCENEDRWNYYQNLLNLACYLGGLGGKKRKGKGAYCLNKNPDTLPKDASELLSMIKAALNVVSNKEYYIEKEKNVLKTNSRNNKYAMLRSVRVCSPLYKSDFEKRVGEATKKGKNYRQGMVEDIAKFSPLIIISAYPSPVVKEDEPLVYPVISQFNFVCEKFFSEINFPALKDNYKKFTRAYENPFKDNVKGGCYDVKTVNDANLKRDSGIHQSIQKDR